MKQIKHIGSFLLLLGTIAGIESCSKFGDMNINPNAATTPVTSALLTNVESSVGNIAANQSTTCFYIQHFSQIQYPDNQLYALTNVGWDDFYSGSLEDLQKIIDVNTANPNPSALGGNSVNQIQIARILRAYYFLTLTDRYGDIPYSQALKGKPSATYDKQQDIYKDLFKELKESIAGFDATGNPIKGDVIYKGDLSMWKRFANSLRMIMAMNLSKVDPATGKTEFIAALNDPAGYISSNAQNFTINYPGSGFNNPFANLTGASQIGISKVIADKLNNYDDPRVFAYGEENTNSEVKGVPYGLNRANIQAWLAANTDWSPVFGSDYKKVNSALTVLPAAYIDLLRAEAALTYNTGEDSYSLLKKGIQDSWEQWSVSDDITNYLTNIGAASSSDVTIPVISEQVWISLYGSSMFAWDEWRRTGYPVLSPAPDANGKEIPRRYGYPTLEPSLNTSAYNTAVEAMPYGGGDKVSSRVWWDKP